MNTLDMDTDQKVHDLLTTPRVVECILCGEPTMRKFVWIPKEASAANDLRCVLYGICENHQVSDRLFDALAPKIMSHFN